MAATPTPALVVHGGAWSIPDDLVAPCRAGVEAAADAAWAALAEGGSALDAVTLAVRALEDDPVFNAGTGASLTSAGTVELDAAVMVSDGLAAGAVAALPPFRNPVLVARRVLEASEHVLLVGAGAATFAREQGFEGLAAEALVMDRERRQHRAIRARAGWTTREPFEPGEGPGDTVGAVAVDVHGTVAAATSTGGTPGKRPGRVGDSPLIGCGTYAAPVGGASCTGWGEAIIRTVMAYRAVAALEGGADAQAAAEAAVRGLGEVGRGRAGLVVVDRRGRVGVAFDTPRMAFALRGVDGLQRSGPD